MYSVELQDMRKEVLADIEVASVALHNAFRRMDIIEKEIRTTHLSNASIDMINPVLNGECNDLPK